MRCRQDESAWPKVQYLWPQHPVVQWLTGRVHAAFGRHRAPVVTLPSFAANEAVFVISGLVPNRRGQPLVYHWLSVGFNEGKLMSVDPFETTLSRTDLGKESLPNTGRPIDITGLQALLPEAVKAARREVVVKRDQFQQEMQAKLAHYQEEIERLKTRQFEQLDLKLDRTEQAPVFKEACRAERTKEINQISMITRNGSRTR